MTTNNTATDRARERAIKMLGTFEKPDSYSLDDVLEFAAAETAELQKAHALEVEKLREEIERLNWLINGIRNGLNVAEVEGMGGEK